MAEYSTNIKLETSTCSCGMTWAAPEKWFKERRKDHKTFYCPNGCNRYYPQENDEEKLKRELKEKQERCLRAERAAEHFEKSAISYRGHVTRLKKKFEVKND